MRILCISVALTFVFVARFSADVWFVQAEGFDPDQSVLQTNENGVNVTWTIVDDNDALGGQFMKPSGANRDSCEACAPLVYPVWRIASSGPYRLWARSIMPTTGSDSFFWQLSTDGGKNFNLPVAAHGGAQWVDWQWQRPWDGLNLTKGDENVLIIAERENNAELDVFCLRDDGKKPTDAEAEQWFEDNPTEPLAVSPHDRLATSWAKLKR